MPTYNTVSITGNNIFGNSSGEVVNVTVAPLSLYFDTVNNTEINAPVATVTSNNAGAWTVSGLIDPTPAGSGLAWKLTVTDKQAGTVLYSATVQIAYANGASQQWLALAPPPAPATATSYLVTPGAQATAAGQFLTSTGAGSSVLSWNFGNNPLNVRNFQADPTGVTDSTTAINNAIAAATGNAAPATHSRAATNTVYLPAGTYKVTADLLIQSVQGFNFIGDGPELTILKASGTGFTNGPITIDGSYAGRFEGFTILGDGTEQVNNAITLTWTVAAQRSSTGNKFADIRVRTLNFVTGFNAAGVGTRQVDGTKLSAVVIGGGQTPGSWLNTGNWQQGFVFGNGSFGNIYDFVLDRCDPSGCYYGFYNNVSSLSLNGSQPANNAFDFYINPGAQSTITNVQSQQCGQFLTSPSNFAPIPTTFNDIQIKTSILNGAGNAFMTLLGGTWNFNNINATNLQVSASYVNGTIVMTGSSSSRPCVANFNNISLRGARTSAFTLTNAVLTVQQYSNYEPTTGLYTAAAGDPSSINIGGTWASVTGTVPPQVNWITATGNTSYTVPAGSQTVFVYLQGGGAQGGGGGLTASGTAGGGSGGSAGGYAWGQFPASILSSPVTVTVGAGGTTGGQASSTPGNPGSNGQAGGVSLFGPYLAARGGSAGQAGATAATAGGAQGGGGGMITGGGSGAGSASASAGGAGLNVGGASGGGGGGGTTGASDANGGTSAAGYFGGTANTGAGGIAASNTAATAATAPTEGGPGGGGGGGYGKSGAATTAGSGANAVANSGAGGGGGGGCSGGTSSGAGGNGGSGFALIIAYFQ